MVGTFEPVPALPRCTATVAVRRAADPWQPVQAVTDDSLQAHLARALAHFTGAGPNPAPPGRALDHLALLNAWSQPQACLLPQGTTP
ncbi:hypothetical protein [Streptomyces griseosporeus]|uniref:hypothetical protein n=1 Tax=Streptomyces griseosporeus TaxID=1910 RepID=UPI0036AAB945